MSKKHHDKIEAVYQLFITILPGHLPCCGMSSHTENLVESFIMKITMKN